MKKWIVAFFMFSPLLASALVFYKDDRQTVNLETHPEYASIGILQSQQSPRRGTAFLVSPCYILTNHHVEGGEGQLLFQLSQGLQSTAKLIVSGGAYEEKDWALLKLENCLGAEVGWLRLSTQVLPPFLLSPMDVKMVGFPEDRWMGQAVKDPSCQIHSPLGDHDCASRGGNSGAPLLNLQNEVVAIHRSADASFMEVVMNYDAHLSNKSVPIFLFYPQISSFIEQDIRLFESQTKNH